MSAPAVVDRECRACTLLLSQHGDPCRYCGRPPEHHEPGDVEAEVEGKRRMAAARQAAGSHLNDLDRELLDLAPAPPLRTLDAPGLPRMHGAPTTQAMRVAAFPRSGTLRAQVLAALHATGGVGMTDDDLERTLDRAHQSVSACRNGLVADGWLRARRLPNGDPLERRNRYDNLAQVWELTPAATAHYLTEHP